MCDDKRDEMQDKMCDDKRDEVQDKMCDDKRDEVQDKMQGDKRDEIRDKMQNEIQSVLTNWDVLGTAKQIYSTAWAISDEYVLKAYDNLEQLKKNGRMQILLCRMGIPAAEIIQTRRGEIYAAEGSRYYMLSRKLPGSNAADITADGMAEKMGEVLGSLHQAFSKCEEILYTQSEPADETISFPDCSLLEEMNGWVKESLYREHWMDEKNFCKAVQKLAEHYEELPRQLIHRDVHLGNFLFDQGAFSGYIDFDLSQRNIRVFDLCYFLAGLLAAQVGNGMEEIQWYDVISRTTAGYESRIPLTAAEKQAVPYVMENIELLFAAYFNEPETKHFRENALELFWFIFKREEQIWSALYS